MSVLRVQGFAEPDTASHAKGFHAVTLSSPPDVLALIEEQVNQVRADPLTDPTERARTLGMLAGLA